MPYIYLNLRMREDKRPSQLIMYATYAPAEMEPKNVLKLERDSVSP